MTRRLIIAALIAVCAALIAAVPARAHHRQVCGLYDGYPPTVATVADCDPAAFFEAPRSSLVRAGGILVNRVIADDVRALLEAAAAAGHSGIGGEGFRTYADQVKLREQHCGPTPYDIYLRPSRSCVPPTATPGRSMHQRGLAIDFAADGDLIASGHPFYEWLVANAADYGLHNFPPEPWHWSTNGR